MRFLPGALCLTGTVLVTSVAAGQVTVPTAPRDSAGSPYARTEVLRAGISSSSISTLPVLPQSGSKHRVKHAAIGAGAGAGLGLVAGAAVGAYIDRTRPGTLSATPIIALEGAGICLLAGLVVGALIP